MDLSMDLSLTFFEFPLIRTNPTHSMSFFHRKKHGVSLRS
ncbi:hypothetical protein ATH50_0802 [Haloplanus aerogenes]|uniref:Uncharacterized protein n=1 Tax=Haloplanus aerogenes TaxID=660522 RepID=A0A3M0DPQ0_9EURY|nr:hypothetical protein ATH50_0802 [Haloplanus aerogenes]